MGHPERLIDWAHRAVHETTVVAKYLIEAFYGQPPQYAYFDGCHNGGRQGLAEAQRYPGDYDKVTETMGGADQTRDFFRLFMAPDMGMCPASFPGTFDAMDALRKWTEEGIAPERIEASYGDGDRVYKTRPVCAYPEAAIYKGEGDFGEAENFRCGIPAW